VHSRNDRAVYRAVYPVTYPASLVPYLVVEGEDGTRRVLDVSEEGIRYRATADDPPPLGTAVAAELRAHNAPPVAVHGHVVRSAPNEVAIKLESPGLPFSLLFREQRAVLIWSRSKVERAE
jgi:hypothetical protein